MGSNRFRFCNRHTPGTPLIIGIGGGSNAAGNAAATGDPADLDYTLPVGCTLYISNTTPLTNYPTDKFGPVVGFIDELINIQGFEDPIVAIVHGVPGSALATWNSSLVAAMETIYATTGHPHYTLFVNGAQDALGGGAATYFTNLSAYACAVRRARGAGQPIALVGLKTVEPLTYVNEAVVLAAQTLFTATNQGMGFIDGSDLAQSVDSHYTAVSMIELGRRAARQLVVDSIVAVP